MNTEHTGYKSSALPTRHIRFLSVNRPGPYMGMGHYERLLIQSLGSSTQNGWSFDITFSGRTPEAPIPDGALDPTLQRADFLGISTARVANLPFPLMRFVMNQRLRGLQTDVFHSLALTFPPPSSAPAVFTIHDLPSAHFPDEGQVPKWAKKAAQSAAAVITPSRFAKDELVEILDLAPEQVHVIYYGCEHDRFHPAVVPASSQELGSHGIKGDFLLYVGGFTRRKNVRALLEAWRSIEMHHRDLTLVLVGPTQQLKSLSEAVNAPRVIVSGYMNHLILPGVMKAARALVFPSIYEGFGLPPQEAMALGVPVLGTKVGGAVPEIVGDAGVLAEDGTALALAVALEKLLHDSELQKRLKVAGPQQVQQFSWAKHAEEVLDIYRGVAQKNGH